MTGSSASLLEHWLLRGVPPQQIGPLIASAQQVRFLPDELIFEEGDTADGLYLISTGSVRVTAQDERGMVSIATLPADDVVGEMGVLDGQPRSGRATAIEHTTAYFLPAEAFLDTLERCNPLCLRLLALLTQRIRVTNGRLAEAPGGEIAPVQQSEPAPPREESQPPSEDLPDLRPLARIFGPGPAAPAPAEETPGSPAEEPFYGWLLRHAEWVDPPGDIARFARDDRTWPREADDIETLRRHVEEAEVDPAVMIALMRAWHAWRVASHRAEPSAGFLDFDR